MKTKPSICAVFPFCFRSVCPLFSLDSFPFCNCALQLSSSYCCWWSFTGNILIYNYIWNEFPIWKCWFCSTTDISTDLSCYNFSCNKRPSQFRLPISYRKNWVNHIVACENAAFTCNLIDRELGGLNLVVKVKDFTAKAMLLHDDLIILKHAFLLQL